MWVGEVGVDIFGLVLEDPLEELAGPLDGVLDGVGEVLQGANRDGLLRGILGGRVRLGHIGKNDLGVSLGSEGARLEEGLLVVNAAAVHVLAGVNIVQGVGHPREGLEEGIAKDLLRVRPHAILVGDDLFAQVGVHLFHGKGGGLGLEFL